MPADRRASTPVPNSDAGFADGYAEGKVLMIEDGEQRCLFGQHEGESPVHHAWLTSMKAIEAYCVGKKASDLTKTSLDAVTGATLVDAPNYLKLVSEVAGSDDITTTGAYAGDGSDLKMGCATAAAHGDKRSRKPFPLCRGTCWLLRASTSSSSPTLRLPAGARAQFGRRLRRRVRRGQGAHVQVGELRYVQRQHEGKAQSLRRGSNPCRLSSPLWPDRRSPT